MRIESSFLKHFLRDERPWGNFIQFTKNEPSTVKILTLLPEKRFSLQKHAHRDEFWYVISGSGLITLNEETKPIMRGDMHHVQTGILHRLTAGKEGLSVLEIGFGDFDEDDIVRIEDDFGRV